MQKLGINPRRGARSRAINPRRGAGSRAINPRCGELIRLHVSPRGEGFYIVELSLYIFEKARLSNLGLQPTCP